MIRKSNIGGSDSCSFMEISIFLIQFVIFLANNILCNEVISVNKEEYHYDFIICLYFSKTR